MKKYWFNLGNGAGDLEFYEEELNELDWDDNEDGTFTSDFDIPDVESDEEGESETHEFSIEDDTLFIDGAPVKMIRNSKTKKPVEDWKKLLHVPESGDMDESVRPVRKHRRMLGENMINEINSKNYMRITDEIDSLVNRCYENKAIYKSDEERLYELRFLVRQYGERAEKWVNLIDNCLDEIGVVKESKLAHRKRFIERHLRKSEKPLEEEAVVINEEENEKRPVLKLDTESLANAVDFVNCVHISRDIEDVILDAIETYMSEKGGIIPEEDIKEYLRSNWVDLITAIYDRGVGDGVAKEPDEEVETKEELPEEE